MTHILVDICHPAHAHFFRGPIQLWLQGGHSVSITSRDKDVAIELLDSWGLEHHSLGTPGKTPISLGVELLRRNLRLIRHIGKVRADVAVGLGGTFAAQSAFLRRIPSVVFYDTEIARLQNVMTYPLATRVVVPNCYRGWTPQSRTTRYMGYHELSYLHPNRFKPDIDVAISAGLDPDRANYLVRIVAWTANHDIGIRGLTSRLLEDLVNRLSEHGNVIISSEAELPEMFSPLLFSGPALNMHHLMAFSSGYFGESATMASECAVLGVPAVYIARTSRGYTLDQEERYGLVHNIHDLDGDGVAAGIEWLLSQEAAVCAQSRQQLLHDCVDVSELASQVVVDCAESFRVAHR